MLRNPSLQGSRRIHTKENDEIPWDCLETFTWAAPRSLSPVLGPGGRLHSILVKAMIIHTLNPLSLGRANALVDAFLLAL
ncbi:unnamed protein product [Gulo gulo]|uniref:Uncharacterized protein n=1 Tax=Gulo gulo TaxID=48420 RepID=A0A9X9LT68_GULGU|nr:unnamed protein product [Gulo gulo]